MRSANHLIQRVFFAAIISCSLWMLYTLFTFHTPSVSRSTHVLNVESLHTPASLKKTVYKLHVQKLVPASITHALPATQSDSTMEYDSEDDDISYLVYKHRSRGKDDERDQQDEGEDYNLGVKNESALQILHNNAIRIVSKLQAIHSDPHLTRYASFFTLRDTVVNHFNSTWLIQTTCPSKGPVLLIVIPSVYSHQKRRAAIRETWGSLAYGLAWPGTSSSTADSVKLIFFLGVSKKYNHEQTLSEADKFQDIVVGDFKDTYRTLNLKMAMVLRWVDERCSGVKYVLKVDEDTFVNVPLLLDMLDLYSRNNSYFVMGHMKHIAKPQVTRSGRWKVPRKEYPLDYWPKYLYGHSYVISGDAIHSLRHASQHMPLVTNEDAYVTGILAKSVQVKRVHGNRFAIQRAFYPRCQLVKNKDISQTELATSALYAVWGRVLTGNCSDGGNWIVLGG